MRYADQNCTYRETYDNKGHYYHFTGLCIATKVPVTVSVKGEELYAYRQGAYIQDALVSNSPAEREFLMSGISEEAFDKMFSEEK